MKNILVTGISITLLAVSPLSFATTLNSMSKTQLEKAINNKTWVSIATDNLNGKTINNTFSMYLDGQGNVWGKMSLKPADEPQTDKGVYSIQEDGTFYMTWQHWDGGKQLCGHVFATQNAYISIDCYDIFHTVFMKEAIQSGNHLN